MVRWLAALLLLVGVARADPVPVAQTRAEPILVEGLAFDHRDRMLVSAVHAAGIFRLGRDGRLHRWQRRTHGSVGHYGLVSDHSRKLLWATTTGSLYDGHPLISPSLWKYDLRTGHALQVINGSDNAKSFGDLALGSDGTVYVSDSGAGTVLSLSPGASALRNVVSLGEHRSPQGLAVSADDRTLVFAEYGSGLHRVDLASGAHTRIETPQGMELRGVDGVVRDDDDLVLVQNGIAPPRVLRLELNADWTAIERLDVLVRDGGMQEPTGGVVHEGAFVFVSRSQWTDFDGEGKLKTPTPAPAVISRLALSPSAAP